MNPILQAAKERIVKREEEAHQRVIAENKERDKRLEIEKNKVNELINILGEIPGCVIINKSNHFMIEKRDQKMFLNEVVASCYVNHKEIQTREDYSAGTGEFKLEVVYYINNKGDLRQTSFLEIEDFAEALVKKLGL